MLTTLSESITEGGLLEVRLQYNFKEQYTASNISSKNIFIKLPDSVNLIDNTVVIDNNNASYSKDSNNIVKIPINNMQGIIKFYVKPTEAKAVQIKAEAEFYYSDKRINEILGVVTLDVNYLTIEGISKTNIKSVKVSGIAPKNSTVNIYDGTVKVGTAVSSVYGKWSTTINLHNAYSGSTHKLTAKINANSNEEQSSNVLNVRYYSKNPVLKDVTMIHNDKSTSLTKAFLEGQKPVITIVPSKPFTFNIKIENSDMIKELYVASERNNEQKTLKAIYDSKKDIWIASGYFDPNNNGYTPGSLNIIYKTVYEKFDLSGDVDFNIFKDELPPKWQDANVDIKEDTQESVKAEITLNDSNKTTIGVTTNKTQISGNITINDLINSGYVTVNNQQFVKYTNYGDSAKISIVDKLKDFSIDIGFELLGYLPGGAGEILGGITGGCGIIDGVLTMAWQDIKIDQAIANIQNNANMTAEQKKYMLNNLNIAKGINAAYNMYKFTATVLSMVGVVNPLFGFGFLAITTIGDALMEEILDILGITNSFTNDGVSPRWLMDPSGYVYESVHDNRLEGVTTTVYYKDEETGEAVLWDAEEFEQQNPLITDENGQYAWYVPEGMWQVKYEKEGYETTYSEWLPVPPPQTTVNIGMVSNKKPEVIMFNLFEDKGEIVFDKYIKTSTVNSSIIQLKDSLNNIISAKIEPADEKIMDN